MKGILLKYLSIQPNVIDLSSNQQYEINRKLKFYYFLIYFSLIKILIKKKIIYGRKDNVVSLRFDKIFITFLR